MTDLTNPETATEAEVTTPTEQTEQTTPQNGQGDPAPTAPQQEQIKYVTAEELERNNAELFRRWKQSSSDRAKQVDQQFAEMKALLTKDAPLTEQQESVLRKSIEAQVDAAPMERSDAVPPELRAQAEFVYSQIDETFAEVGMSVGPNDKEWPPLEAALNDPRGSLAKTLRVAAKQAEEKIVRVSSQKKNAQARVVSGGLERTTDPGDISQITDSKELYRLGEKKLAEQNNRR